MQISGKTFNEMIQGVLRDATIYESDNGRPVKVSVDNNPEKENFWLFNQIVHAYVDKQLFIEKLCDPAKNILAGNLSEKQKKLKAAEIFEFFEGRDGSNDDMYDPFAFVVPKEEPVKHMNKVYNNLADELSDKYFGKTPTA